MDNSRATLTQRRRRATQLEIAQAATALFAEKGMAATTVEEIVSAAGVSLRTFYRYFGAKHAAVVPLLELGAEGWQSQLARIDADADLRDAVADVVSRSMSLSAGGRGMDLAVTRQLIRTVLGDPDLLHVWDTVNGDSERALWPIFSELSQGSDPVAMRMLAAAATHSIRLSLETWAAPGAPDSPEPNEIAAELFDDFTAWWPRTR